MRDELRILVVDDLHDAAEMLAAALTLEGFDAKTAFDCMEALAIVVHYKPHVVLFDVGMPGMDGCDLSRILRERYGDEMVLIAVTGRDTSDPRVLRSMDLSDHYFLKPIDMNALRKVLSVPTPSAPRS